MVSSSAETGRTKAVYYRDANGNQPVDEFIERLDERRQAGLDFQIDRLNGHPAAAPPLPFPHTSQVRAELRELRCHFGSEHYRIFYRRSRNLLVLLHIVRKTTAKLPAREVAVAEAPWEDFERRMNEEPRSPPRAGGQDAP